MSDARSLPLRGAVTLITGAAAPKHAAERIARAIERCEPRVLVGDDARRAAWVQRLFPVGYWKLAVRDIARRIGRDPAKAPR